jgi:hypothetical protein
MDTRENQSSKILEHAETLAILAKALIFLGLAAITVLPYLGA